MLWTVVHDLSRRIKSAKTHGARSQRYTSNMMAVEVSRTIDPSIAARVVRNDAADPTTPKLYISKCDALATRPFYRTSCGSRVADVQRPTASNSLPVNTLKCELYLGESPTEVIHFRITDQ